MKNLARRNKKKEEEEKLKKAEPVLVENKEINIGQVNKKVQDENLSSVAKRHKGWLGAMFGGFMFLSSSAGLFLLYKYRKHFSL